MSNKGGSVIRKKIQLAQRVLESRLGVPTWRKKEPLDELIVTILSQNTNDRNRDHAYLKLREALPTWVDVLSADVTVIERTIHSAGLSRQKSQRIHDVLQWVSGRFGSLTLRPLEELPDDDVIKLLTTQKGIGIKTAAVVLAFSFGRDICPVDTHVHRISKRLGWVEEKTDAEKTFHALRPHIPDGKAVSFHLNLLKFGRNICTSRNPHCEDCPLWDDCSWDGRKPQ